MSASGVPRPPSARSGAESGRLVSGVVAPVMPSRILRCAKWIEALTRRRSPCGHPFRDRCSTAFLALMLSANSLASISMQLHRFPLLAPVTAGIHPRCKATTFLTPALLAEGITRMVTAQVDGEPSRAFAVSTDRAGHVRVVSAFYSVAAGRARHEGESVMIFYGPDGVLAHGTRRYSTTGTPARRDEDRAGDVTRSEADSALSLGQGVLKLCAQ